jgi:phage terminase large subunit-like protein
MRGRGPFPEPGRVEAKQRRARSARFVDAPVYGGLDLWSRQDLTALVLVARDSAGAVPVQPHFCAPAQGLREPAARDRGPYDLWRDQGYLTATPGASVDHEYVAQCLANRAARCNLPLASAREWFSD